MLRFSYTKRLAEANPEEMKQCRASWRKAEYIKILAEEAADRTFDRTSKALSN